MPVLKGANFLIEEAKRFISSVDAVDAENWQLLMDYHCGGYAKISPALADFIDDFGNRTGIPLEPVYSGKMFYALSSLLKQNYFKAGSTVVALHTGGMQGIRGNHHRLKRLLSA